MLNSSLVQLIQMFKPVELREVRKFLASPYFNQRKDLIELFDWICRTPSPTLEQGWRLLKGDKPYAESGMRLIMSYLHQLLEEYLIIREVTADPLAKQVALVSAYRKRLNHAACVRAGNTLERAVEKQPLRNAHYHNYRYQLHWAFFQVENVQNPTELPRIRELSAALDCNYLSQKLRLYCLSSAHQTVYSSEAVLPEEQAVLDMAVQPERLADPAVSIYLSVLRMLQDGTDESHFKQVKMLLFDLTGRFPEDEMHGLYVLAINYCVRQLNTGDQRFFREVLDLYQAGLMKGYLHEHGILSRFTYHNVVAAALHTGEHDWARGFIHSYKNHLEKRYRESAFSFNLARLEYAQANYGLVLELLQTANYRDPLLNLAAKTLLLKTYYDLREHNLLHSHLDAMRNYIHRKRVIGYHRSNYLNVVRYMEKLLKLMPGDKPAHRKLWAAIQAEEHLSEKAFFENILFDLQ